jgi:Rrf2 family protein
MKLSTKSRYGLRAVVDLALHYRYGPMAVATISKKEGISTHYLEQILNKLKKANIVKSLRGPKGGYTLAKNPNNITVAEVVGILEGGISPVSCVLGRKKKRPCERMDKCVTKVVWDKLASRMKETLEAITLSDLLKEAKKLGVDDLVDHGYTFHI